MQILGCFRICGIATTESTYEHARERIAVVPLDCSPPRLFPSVTIPGGVVS